MIPTFFAVLCLWAVWWARGSSTRIIGVMVVSTVFGAAAAGHIIVMGGAPLTPSMFLAPFVVAFAIRKAGWTTLAHELAPSRPGLWFALFAVWAAIAAVVMPWAFEGKVYVYTTSRFGDLSETGRVALQAVAPNSTNITQAIYIATGAAVCIAIAALMRSAGAAAMALKALLTVAGVNAFFGIVNLIEGYANVNLGLALLRNARYQISNTYEVAGLVRVHGSFAEPSVFSMFCVPLVAALLVCWVRGYRVAWSAPLCVISLVLTLIGTSTTAYVGIVATLVPLALIYWGRLLVGASPLRFGSLTIACLGVVALVSVALLVRPEWWFEVVRFLDATVFTKLQSASGVERSSWTMQSWQNFVDTYGLGVGTGSGRGSNWPVILLGNTGVIGATLFLAFLSILMLRRAPSGDIERTATWAFKAFMLGVLVTISIAGAMIDLGMSFYLAAGVVAGLAFNATATSTARARVPQASDRGPTKSIGKVDRNVGRSGAGAPDHRMA
jgi:hypothetical protein